MNSFKHAPRITLLPFVEGYCTDSVLARRNEEVVSPLSAHVFFLSLIDFDDVNEADDRVALLHHECIQTSPLSIICCASIHTYRIDSSITWEETSTRLLALRRSFSKQNLKENTNPPYVCPFRGHIL